MKLLLEKFGGFLRTVGRSCYDMEFYRGVRTRPATRAIAYFASFAALLVLLGAMRFGPDTFGVFRDGGKWVETHLADGATLTLKDGKLSSNIAQPSDFGSGGKFVLDTGVEGGAFPEELYPKADIVIGRDAIFVRQDPNQLRTQLLAGYPDLSWTKEQLVSRSERYGWMIALGMILFSALFYWFFLTFGMAVYVAIVSLLALLAGKIWKVGMGYGQWAAVGFHALTLPMLVDIALEVIGLNIPYSFSFIYVLFIGAVIADERTSPAGPVVLPAAPQPAVAVPISPEPPKEKKLATKSRKPAKKPEERGGGRKKEEGL